MMTFIVILAYTDSEEFNTKASRSTQEPVNGTGIRNDCVLSFYSAAVSLHSLDSGS